MTLFRKFKKIISFQDVLFEYTFDNKVPSTTSNDYSVIGYIFLEFAKYFDYKPVQENNQIITLTDFTSISIDK